MKNKLLAYLAFILSPFVCATTTTLPLVVDRGNELDFFSQLVDVFVLKIMIVTGNVGIYVVALVTFCVLAALATVVLLIAGIILKNRK